MQTEKEIKKEFEEWYVNQSYKGGWTKPTAEEIAEWWLKKLFYK